MWRSSSARASGGLSAQAPTALDRDKRLSPCLSLIEWGTGVLLILMGGVVFCNRLLHLNTRFKPSSLQECPYQIEDIVTAEHYMPAIPRAETSPPPARSGEPPLLKAAE